MELTLRILLYFPRIEFEQLEIKSNCQKYASVFNRLLIYHNDDDDDDDRTSVLGIMQRCNSIRGGGIRRDSRLTIGSMDPIFDTAELRRSSTYTTSSG